MICTLRDAAVVARIRLPTVTTVEEIWKRSTYLILQAAGSELGMTKPERRKIEKQIWLWTDDVKEKIKEKKRLYNAFLSEKTADNWRIYEEANRAAKKSVAVAKTSHYDEDNEKLEMRDAERQLYWVAKTRHRQGEDIEKFFCINDENGHPLMNLKRAVERLHEFQQ
ncbi:unnamed protein product [Heligmosomoides polygyrus]|uniref:Uncharacterized protein n=1 Tax=Heligmosomoides polygyrus TaxID=6339 RepID=A0A3P7TFB3_HELPZ|nr:unnamed protein product [Heligmosomoides polygyrus]